MNSILSSRYARAIFDLAIEVNLLDQVSKDIFFIEEVCQENVLLTSIMKNPNINIGSKKKIIRDIFEDKVEKLSLDFIILLVDKRRVVYLKEIANEFHAIFNEYHNIKVANLIVSNEASDDIIAQMKAILEQKFNCKIELKVKIQKDIIGGFKLLVDGNIYDASISKQLNLLRKSFAKNIYEKGF
ncbi:MAG: synthase subunit delta [Bacteroidetes bacterium]|nr:synthase subunit delta [Bacteroidota bacterium]